MDEVKTIDYQTVFSVQKKYAKSILISSLIVILIFISLYFILPFKYKATATILPQSKSGGGGLSSFVQSLAGGLTLPGAGNQSQNKLYEYILKSRTLNENILQSIGYEEFNSVGLDSNSIMGALLGAVETSVNNVGLLEVNYYLSTGYLPNNDIKVKIKEFIPLLCNTAIDELDKMLINQNVTSSKLSRVYIEKEIKRYRKKSDSISHAIVNFQSENNIYEIETQVKAIVDQSVDVGTELLKLETELNLAKINYSANSPVVKSLTSQVEYLRRRTSQLQEGISDYKFAIPLNQIPELSKKYLELYRDRKVLEQVLLYLETQRHQEAIAEQKETPIVKVLDYAIEPNSQFSPSFKILLVVGLTLWGIFLFIFLLFYDRFKNGTSYIKSI